MLHLSFIAMIEQLIGQLKTWLPEGVESPPRDGRARPAGLTRPARAR
jgi:hypothetical protein